MIGAGVFSVLGLAVGFSGSAVFLSFILFGVVALFTAYSYAKLGVRYPSLGGTAEYLVRGFGDRPLTGVFGIMLYLGYVSVIALYAYTFGSYAALFVPFASPLIRHVFITLIVLSFMLVNLVGADAMGKTELVVVFIKVAVLIAFIVAGLISVNLGMLAPSNWPDLKGILAGGAIIFMAYEGFGLISNGVEEMEDPERNLPRALYLSVIIVIVIYTLIGAVVGCLPVEEVARAKEYALAVAALPLMGQLGFLLISVVALLSTSSAINATMFGAMNVARYLARNGKIPSVFDSGLWGKEHAGGLLTTTVLILFLANLLNLEGISLMASSLFLLVYGLVNLANFRLRRETGSNPLLPLIGFFSCAFSFMYLIWYSLTVFPVQVVFLLAILSISILSEYVYRKL